MRSRLVALAASTVMLIGFLTGCCVKFNKPVVEEPEPEVIQLEWIPQWPAGKHSFGIFHYNGMAHGCAVNGKTLTNRHVIDITPEGTYMTSPPQMRFRYTFPRGIEGYGKSLYISQASDAAVVELDKQPPNYAPLATGPPAIGETVVWVEYDFREEAKSFSIRYRQSVVTQVRAGMVVIEGDVVQGASGGCAYNRAGEVIGLITWRKDNEDYSKVSGITGLWGDWWEYDEEPEPAKTLYQMLEEG